MYKSHQIEKFSTNQQQSFLINFGMIASRVAIFFLLGKISHETWGVLRSCLNDRRSATSQGRYQGEDGRRELIFG